MTKIEAEFDEQIRKTVADKDIREWLNLHTAEDLYALVWSRDDETLPVKIKSMRAWLRIHGGGWDWINRIFELKEKT